MPDLSPTDTQRLADWLGSHDEKCPVCSYSLRALTRPACPECGAALRLCVFSPNLSLGPWFVGVVSLSLGLGFDGVVSVLVIAVIIYDQLYEHGRMSGFFAFMFVVFAAAAAICAVALAWAFWRRRLWTRLPLRRQWLLAAAIFLVTGAGHVLLGLFVRLILK